MQPIYYLTLQQISQKIKSMELSPVEVTTACLDRIKVLNPRLNAFITVLAKEAQAGALQAEQEIAQGKWRGPLHGVPIAIKDMYDTKGIATTAAFEPFKNRIPKKDAAVITKLHKAGAIIIGKTNMHQLAMGTTSQISAFGAVHNPWNVEYIPGGSSGGSAAAVASGMCYATIDTDAIGSCRLPAACCGVVGYKCTWGALDNSGILEGEQADPGLITLSTMGIQTRSVGDVSLLLDVLKDTPFNAPLQKPILGMVTNYGADKEVRANFEKTMSAVDTLGYTNTSVELPIDTEPDMHHIEEHRKTANKTLFSTADILVLPTTASKVPKAETVKDNPQGLSPHNTFLANYFGLPALTVPCGFDTNGLPLGLQFVGRQKNDRDILEIGAVYEAATSWHTRHPLV